MLIQPWDQAPDDWWRGFVEAQGFGHLVAGGGPRREVPIVVPTQFIVGSTPSEGMGEVVLHLARPNPVWAAIEERPTVVLSVAGDWAYVPSAWKATDDEDPTLGIPTTYYAAAQLTARAHVLDDPDEIADILRRTLAHLQPHIPVVDPLAHGAKLRAIRGLRLEITDVRAKAKYGGNVDVEHRLAVAERLRERQGPGDAAALRHMAKGLDPQGRESRVKFGAGQVL